MSEALRAYIGTYTTGGSVGIYLGRYHPDTGALDHLEPVAETENPSFLALHPSGRWLYAVNEVSRYGDWSGGAVAAFEVDPATGRLELLDQQPSEGTVPCHVAVDATGQAVMVANYGSGSVASYRVEPDGRLSAPASVFQHQGAGADPGRQKGPHAHSVTLAPDNRFVFACDLGLDQVLVYRLDPASAKLTQHNPPFARTHDGAGPRHMAFHPNGRWAYVINELDSTMTAYAYHATAGKLDEIGHWSTLPEGYSEKSYCADVHVHAGGRFVYGTNRGHDSLCLFEIDQETGGLTLLGCESTQGKFPRNFAIDPAGRFVVAANQNSDDIYSYRLDANSGRLTPTGDGVAVGAPVCVLLVA